MVEMPAIVADTASYRSWLDPLLRDAYAKAEAGKDARKQLHASLALLPDGPRPGGLPLRAAARRRTQRSAR